MADDIAIRVEGVSKNFKLPLDKHNSLKSKVVHVFGKTKGYQTQHALKDVSFEVKKGEFFGIVGRNGSGKSTLLKMLAGIYQPTEGKISVEGKLVPFIELGVGFNPELTGRENVFLNGALLGFNNDQVAKMYDDIVEFAELEKFMDQKLKNYSSGMQVRLAFSMAIRANADILVLDEVLAVGDEAFQRKCYQYFAELKRNKQTVILVTHSMDVVQQFCTRAMIVDKNHPIEIDNPMRVSQMYRQLNYAAKNTGRDQKEDQKHSGKNLSARINAEVSDKSVNLDIELVAKNDLDEPVIGVEIFRDTGEQVFRWVTDENIDEVIEIKKGSKKSITINVQNVFPVGKYFVRLVVRKRDRTVDYGMFDEITSFGITNNTPYVHNTLWQPDVKYLLKK